MPLMTALASTAVAMSGRKVHVLTPDDSITIQLEAGLREHLQSCGLRAAVIVCGTPVSNRRVAYRASVTVISAREALRDYLDDRLQLHFSRNCIDWCFAGLVTVGPGDKCSRSYASMAIDGDDLHVLSRSGDEHARNAHDVNFISFHTVRNFRDLVY